MTPFQFSGFHAQLHFTQDEGTNHTHQQRIHSSVPPTNAYHTSILSDPSGIQDGSAEGSCIRIFTSNFTRSGHFDTASFSHFLLSFSSFSRSSSSSSSSSSQISPHFPLPAPPSSTRRESLSRKQECRLRFVGRTSEVIQISFFKYRLGGTDCSSEFSVYDGVADNRSRSHLIHHICGPITREPKDSSGKFVQPEFLISSSNILEVKMTFGKGTEPNNQFLAGAYQFHSSRLEGTKKPDSVCDVMFYGANSPSRGILKQPNTALLWNLEGELTCSYLFVPGVNQSLELKVQSVLGNDGSGRCKTICTPAGCKCHSSGIPMQKLDHIYFVDSRRDRVIGCMCGEFRNTTPITILSTYGVDFRYHVARYVWSSPRFNFTLEYHFPPPTLCGSFIHDAPAGLLVPPSDFAIAPGVYIFATCSWIVENQRDSSLSLIIQPPSTGSCDIWNMSVEGRVPQGEDSPLGSVCGGGAKGTFYLVPSHSAALIKLERRGRNIRDWLLTWQTRRSGMPITEIEQFTPKPELSRTLHGNPTVKTFIVRSESTNCSTRLYVVLLQLIFFILYQMLLESHSIHGPFEQHLTILKRTTS